MVPGFNTDFKYRGETYHVQTEDNGTSNPVVVTLLYHKGAILASRKTSYRDLLGKPKYEQELMEMMKAQHKELMRSLLAGAFDKSGAAPSAGGVGDDPAAAAAQVVAMAGGAAVAPPPPAAATPPPAPAPAAAAPQRPGVAPPTAIPQPRPAFRPAAVTPPAAAAAPAAAQAPAAAAAASAPARAAAPTLDEAIWSYLRAYAAAPAARR